MGHPGPSTISGRLWSAAVIGAIAVRVVVVGLLLAGPWTDEPAELAGWDAERFQEIADREGSAWVDQPIEYPPGSVMILDRLAGRDVVDTNRTIVAVSALIEFIGVALLWRLSGPRAAGGFLLFGTPLVPMGLLRLDMAATVMALAAALALLAARTQRAESEPAAGRGEPAAGRGEPAAGRGEPAAGRGVTGTGTMVMLFACLVAAGTMIKIWPGLLVAGAWAVGRRTAAVAALVVTGLVAAAWLGSVGAGLDPVDQIVSLRGATGWHVESVPGALTALVTDAVPRLELNAFRIGTLDPTLVAVGRIMAAATIAILVAAAARDETGPVAQRFALVMLGSTAALIATAPLLSPQFLLWLTPWAALAMADDRAWVRARPPLVLAAIAVVLTGGTLTAFGPDRVADRIPAMLLTMRNLSLLALPVACILALRVRLSAADAPDGADSDGGDRAGAPVWR